MRTKIEKIFLFPYSSPDELSNDTSLNSTMNISIGQNCFEKNPFEYI